MYLYPIIYADLIKILHTVLATALICLSGISLVMASDSTALEPVVVDSARVKIYSANQLNTPYNQVRHYDYKVDGFQQYLPSNNLLRTFNPDYFIGGFSDPAVSSILSDLGVNGSAGRSQIYKVNTKPGIDFGFHSYDHLKFHPDQTLFYNVKSPFTDVYFALGPKEEEILSVLHTQNVNKLINVGFNYRLGGGEGIYIRQVNKRVNFKAFTSIDSKNDRYHLNAQVIWNELKNEQSGGISEDSLFEDSTSITRKNLPVNLYNATSAENQQIYSLNQRFDFGKSTEVQINDSVTETNFDGKLRMYHSAVLDKGAVYYSDINPDPDYYSAIYHDSLQTDNHVHRRILTNTFGLVTLDLDPTNRNKFNGGISGVHEYILYNRYQKDTTAYNGIIKGFISNSAYARFYWKLGGDYAVEGINASDYRWDISTRYTNKKHTQYLDYSMAVQQRAPSMIYYFYEGNHYRWETQFLKQHNAMAKLAYTFKEHNARVGVRGDIIGRNIYYDETGVPQQDTNEISIYSLYIVKDFNWKHFAFKNRVQYQVVSDSATLRVPEIITSHSIYYHNFLFKKALYMQIGFDVLFNTSYYADAYVPSTQQFQLQSIKKIGNYPYLDFFINLNINKAKIFVKASHINQGFMGNTYYTVPHYPRNDMAFVAGISWRFFD